jgi:DNA-binding CsgD family transcriptional regulator
LEGACEYVARGRGKRKRPATGWAALTATEARVAALAAEGQTNAQVGEQLFMSRHTVDSHLRHIYAKLGVSTRAELATRVARQDGADV